MEWLSENWSWLLIGAAFVLMHVFGHGKHSGHTQKQESKKHFDHRH